jgi:hypothetical protein
MTGLPPSPDPTPRPAWWGWEQEPELEADACAATRQVAASLPAAPAPGSGQTHPLPVSPDAGAFLWSGSAGRPPVRFVLAALGGVLLLAVLGSLSGASFWTLFTSHHPLPSRVATRTGRHAAPVPTPAFPSLTVTPQSGAGVLPTPVPPDPTPRPSPVIGRPRPQVLAADTFGRPDQPLWGRASDGLLWDGEANVLPAFAIRSGTGQIHGGAGFFTALLGPVASSVQVLVTGAVSHFSRAGAVNLGVVMHWQNASNYDKAYLDGRTLVVMQRVAGVMTILGQVPFAAQDGRTYTLRLVAVGSRLLARAWPTGTREPATWLVQVSAPSLPTGRVGIRVLLQPGCVITIASFQAQDMSGQAAEEGI